MSGQGCELKFANCLFLRLSIQKRAQGGAQRARPNAAKEELLGHCHREWALPTLHLCRCLPFFSSLSRSLDVMTAKRLYGHRL